MAASLRRIGLILAELDLFFVVVVVGLSTIVETFLPYALGIIIISALIRWAGSGRLVYRTPMDFGIVLIGIMTVVTVLITTLPDLTYPQVIRLVIGIGLFYSIVSWASSVKKIEGTFLATVLFGVILAGAALISVQWVVDKLRFLNFAFLTRLPEIILDRVHPNVMAGNLAIFVPFALGAALFSGKHFSPAAKVCLGGLALAIGGVIVLTQSRGAFLAVIVGVFILAWLRSVWVGVGLSVIGLAGLAYAYFSGFDFIRAYYWLVASGGDTLGIRMEIWSRALFMLHDFPFTGVGMGSFQDVMNMLYPLRPTPVEIGHAHQIFLQVAVDLGIPGLIGWGSCLLATFACAWDLFRKGRHLDSWWMRTIGACVLAGMTAVVVHGLTDAVTWGTRASVIVWGIWGVCAGAWVFQARGITIHSKVAA
ncbi:MAG: O-antigen ligase family protein [Anaerolineales bacterium]